MAELVDALDSGSSDFTVIQVQVLLPAPNSINPNFLYFKMVRIYFLVKLKKCRNSHIFADATDDEQRQNTM